jgi:hypothetical protein
MPQDRDRALSITFHITEVETSYSHIISCTIRNYHYITKFLDEYGEFSAQLTVGLCNSYTNKNKAECKLYIDVLLTCNLFRPRLYRYRYSRLIFFLKKSC